MTLCPEGTKRGGGNDTAKLLSLYRHWVDVTCLLDKEQMNEVSGYIYVHQG